MFRGKCAESAAVAAFRRIIADQKVIAVLVNFGKAFENNDAFLKRMFGENNVADGNFRVRINQNSVAVFQVRQHRIAFDTNGSPHTEIK